MQTAPLAAYIQSRKMRFAGAPVTLAKILQMWQLPHDGGSTLGDAAIEGVARYCKMTVAELYAAVDAMTPVAVPVRAPVPLPGLPPPATGPLMKFASVTIPPAALTNIPAPLVIESPKPAPDPTTEIPKEQLSDLVDASRRSSPVIAAPAAAPAETAKEPTPDDDDHDVEISFDEVEPTPIPDGADATSTVEDTKSVDTKSSKSKKNKKKKS